METIMNSPISDLEMCCLVFALWLGFFSPESRAVEQDKVQHFAGSAAMAAAATAALEGRTAHPIIYGVASSFAVGIAKEAYDKAHPKNHTASGADLAADLLGATVGAWAGHGLYVQAGRGNVALGISKDF
jgi:uncharacterized protein YfiM (DUF2279 family)